MGARSRIEDFGTQILEVHGGDAEASMLSRVWLPQLPLEVDDVEATSAHEQLVRMVEASDTRCASLRLWEVAGASASQSPLTSTSRARSNFGG